MKTFKNLYGQICSYENLYDAYLKARRGKGKSEEIICFTYNLENELDKLQCELINGSYKTGEYRHFVIFEPKERKISALPFRDRIIHHAICSIIGPIFERKFIFDSYACRKKKGTHAGVMRLQKFIGGVSEDAYVLKCDISKYFFSVDCRVLKRIIRKKISDEKLLCLLDNVIDSSKSGIPIGNLTSQLFANIYLNELDEFVKYELREKYYVRYMDDFLILNESKYKLHKVKDKIELFLSSIKLKFHPKKVNIFPVRLGVDFLGYRIFRDYRLIRKSTVKRFIRNVNRKIKRHNLDLISFDKLLESFNSWEAYMAYGKIYKLRSSLYIIYFKGIM